MKKLKHMYVNFVMMFSCKLNCTYCTIPLELRRNVEFLKNDKIKLALFQSIKFLEDQGRLENRSLNLVEDYRKPNVSDKVVRIIHSHTDYVNRVIWRRYDN